MEKRILPIIMLWASILILTCCVMTQAADNTLTIKEKSQGWKLLFDGKTLRGWKCTNDRIDDWFVKAGTLSCKGKDHSHRNNLYTTQTFRNFELKCDFKVDHKTNSGIFFRWTKPSDPVQTGIEMQILDSASKSKPNKHDCGAIYDCLAPSDNAMKPAHQWNSVTIKCNHNRINITLNGKNIIAMDLNKWTKANKNPDGAENKFNTPYKYMLKAGHIGFQDHGSKVWYRNIRIREFK